WDEEPTAVHVEPARHPQPQPEPRPEQDAPDHQRALDNWREADDWRTPDRPATDASGPTARLAALTRRAAAGLGAVAIARWPAGRAALLPRLPRLALAVVGGLLMFASFPVVNWWWAAVVAAALL